MKPDPRHVRLAIEYRASWIGGRVVSCSRSSLLVRVDTKEAVYALDEARSPFAAGADIELCPDWNLARRGRKYVVIFSNGTENGSPLDGVLPSEAIEWPAAGRAGWIYGFEQWVENEDWIDVSWIGLTEDDDFDLFESYAFTAFTDMHLENPISNDE